MHRKVISMAGIFLLFVAFYSCSSHPEKGLLERYFHANSLKDTATMSAMAIEPLALEVESWEILSISEEKIEPAKLPEMNKEEQEFKKNLEDHVGPTVAADDALYEAKEKLKAARTQAAKRAAQKELDEAQVKFDEERALHNQLQTDYNQAKAQAAREEEITSFSLGAGDLPNIRNLTGDGHSKEITIRTQTKSGTKDYKIYLRRYMLKDEDTNQAFRGRWIILKFENLD